MICSISVKNLKTILNQFYCHNLRPRTKLDLKYFKIFIITTKLLDRGLTNPILIVLYIVIYIVVLYIVFSP